MVASAYFIVPLIAAPFLDAIQSLSLRQMKQQMVEMQ
jgi:hypothetical protein